MPHRPLCASRLALLGLSGAFALLSPLACETKREAPPPVTYAGLVAPLLEAACVRCHAGDEPAAGWSADTYIGAIGCTTSGEPVTVGSPEVPAALLRALDRADHAGLVTAGERATLAAWIASETPLRGGGVHPPAFANPRSPESHGRALRAQRWAPMLDPAHPDACGACHDGAPSSAARAGAAAPRAPSCASCHAEPEGALGCGTCHGEGPRAYPPRSACFFPGSAADRVHAAHAGASASREAGLPCSTCHPTPTDGRPDGVHGNGFADVWFDYAVAGREARFDAVSKSCTGTCHARPGGARPTPAWGASAAMTCNDCHSSPPPEHYKGPCTTCHHEANADGTALTRTALHLDGKVDLGDGSGACGACHGKGDDPWPSTGLHAAHANPKSARAVACVTCHETPHADERHPVGRGAAAVRLGGLAARGGRRPSFDPVTKSCAQTYCHEGSGAVTPAPIWAEGTTATCASCHGAPPPPPHAQTTSCGGATCHEGRTDGLTITPAGRLGHVDGKIDRGPI